MNRESLVGKEFAYLSGLIDAKGSIDTDQQCISLRFSILDTGILDTVTDVLSQLRITYSILSCDTERDTFNVVIGGNDLVNLLSNIYLCNQVLRGRLCDLLNINPINAINANTQSAWLAGIIDNLGYVHKPKGPRSTVITIYNFNKDIQPHVIDVLNSMGIRHTIKKGHAYITKAIDILKVYNQVPIQSTNSLLILDTIANNIRQKQRYKYRSEDIYQLHILGMNFTQICQHLGINTSNSGRLCKQLIREGYVVNKGINRQTRRDIQPILPRDILDKVYEQLRMGVSARAILRTHDIKTSSHRLLNQLEREGYNVKPFRRS